jgi:hypothetical protein
MLRFVVEECSLWITDGGRHPILLDVLLIDEPNQLLEGCIDGGFTCN